jgi:hypothetical protein
MLVLVLKTASWDITVTDVAEHPYFGVATILIHQVMLVLSCVGLYRMRKVGDQVCIATYYELFIHGR